MAWPRDPMMVIPNECWVSLQLLIPFMSPFSNMIRAVFLPPFCASTSKDWVVSLEFFQMNHSLWEKRQYHWQINPTTVSPELFAAVLTWNVRPCCCLRQWNLSWVKEKSFTNVFQVFRSFHVFWWRFCILLIKYYSYGCRFLLFNSFFFSKQLNY